jgi:hypothetical protein
MYEARSRIISNAATVQRERRIAKFRCTHSRHPDIYRHRLHMEAMSGRTLPVCPEVFIRPGRAIGTNYVDLGIGAPQGTYQIMKQVQDTRIVLSNIARPVVPQIQIDSRQRFGVVTIPVPIHNVEPLASVNLVQVQPKGRLSGQCRYDTARHCSRGHQEQYHSEQS